MVSACPQITKRNNFSRSWTVLSFYFAVTPDYFTFHQKESNFLQFTYLQDTTNSQTWSSMQYFKPEIHDIGLPDNRLG